MTTLKDDRCWEAIQRRDAAYDGTFYFGVITTGVFCRPSCPARHPLRKNVRFYATVEAAQHDGLRACLRCTPCAAANAHPQAERIREACRFIETHRDEALPLRRLAEHVGLSPFHFQRSFKAITGVTPRHYLEAMRLRALKDGLKRADAVTEALYDAGYGSASTVYMWSDARLGMTPNEYRRGGRGVGIAYATFETPVGLVMIGATDRGICFVQFGETSQALFEVLKNEYPSAQIEPMRTPYDAEFKKWTDALRNHLAGTQPHLDLPLDIRATAFQLRVWQYVQSIPYGDVQSYAEVAAGIGAPAATRAVANACAKNTVAIAIPCHRVIRGNGELGGYRWGTARKRVLIDSERSSKRDA